MESLVKFEDSVVHGEHGETYTAIARRAWKLLSVKKVFVEVHNDERLRLSYRYELQRLLYCSLHCYCTRLIYHDIAREGETDVIHLVFESLGIQFSTFLYHPEAFDAFRHVYFVLGKDDNYHLSPRAVQIFLRRLCEGVASMHRHKIAHRCLTIQAIQVNVERGTLKIGNWEATTCLDPFRGRRLISEIWYEAPEVLLGGLTNPFAMNMWSVGCIFAEMVLRRVMFNGKSESEQLYEIFGFLGTPNEELWPGVTSLRHWQKFPQWYPQDKARVFAALGPLGIDLLKKMLECNPARRISAEEALSHRYFDDLDTTRSYV